MHFHLIAGTGSGPCIAQARYDTYEDSIKDLVNISTLLFAHLPQVGDNISFEKAIDATEHGDGPGVYVGTNGFCLFWLPCDDCQPPIIGCMN